MTTPATELSVALRADDVADVIDHSLKVFLGSQQLRIDRQSPDPVACCPYIALQITGRRRHASADIVAIQSLPSALLHGFEQEPGAALGFVDPHLDEAGAGNIALRVAERM
jgi:hypothetical protein